MLISIQFKQLLLPVLILDNIGPNLPTSCETYAEMLVHSREGLEVFAPTGQGRSRYAYSLNETMELDFSRAVSYQNYHKGISCSAKLLTSVPAEEAYACMVDIKEALSKFAVSVAGLYQIQVAGKLSIDPSYTYLKTVRDYTADVTSKASELNKYSVPLLPKLSNMLARFMLDFPSDSDSTLIRSNMLETVDCLCALMSGLARSYISVLDDAITKCTNAPTDEEMAEYNKVCATLHTVSSLLRSELNLPSVVFKAAVSENEALALASIYCEAIKSMVDDISIYPSTEI